MTNRPEVAFTNGVLKDGACARMPVTVTASSYTRPALSSVYWPDACPGMPPRLTF